MLQAAKQAAQVHDLLVLEGPPGRVEQHTALAKTFKAELKRRHGKAACVTASAACGTVCLAPPGSLTGFCVFQFDEVLQCKYTSADFLPWPALSRMEQLFVHHAHFLHVDQLLSGIARWKTMRGADSIEIVLSMDTHCDNDAHCAMLVDELRKIMVGSTKVLSIQAEKTAFAHYGSDVVDVPQQDLRRGCASVFVEPNSGEQCCLYENGTFHRLGINRRYQVATDFVQNVVEGYREYALPLGLEPLHMDLSAGDIRDLIWTLTQYPKAQEIFDVKSFYKNCGLKLITVNEWCNHSFKKGRKDLALPELPEIVHQPRGESDSDNMARVHAMNEARVAQLQNKAKKFSVVIELSEDLNFISTRSASAKMVVDVMPVMLPELLVLKIGTVVLLLFTLDQRLPAGTLGVVCGFEKGGNPEVQFTTMECERITVVLDRVTQVVKLVTAEQQYALMASQLPLAVAFCLSPVTLRAVRLRYHACVRSEAALNGEFPGFFATKSIQVRL